MSVTSGVYDHDFEEMDGKEFRLYNKFFELAAKATGMTSVIGAGVGDDDRLGSAIHQSTFVYDGNPRIVGGCAGISGMSKDRDNLGPDDGEWNGSMTISPAFLEKIVAYLDANIPKECARCATMPPEGICEDCMKAMDMQLQIASVFNTRAVDVRPKNGDTVASIGRTHTFANGFWEFSTGTAARHAASHQAELTLLWVADNFHCTRKAANNG